MSKITRSKLLTPIELCRMIVEQSQFRKFKEVKSLPDYPFVVVKDLTDEEIAHYAHGEQNEEKFSSVQSKWTILDGYTASIICVVYDNVADHLKRQLETFSMLRLVNVSMIVYDRMKK